MHALPYRQCRAAANAVTKAEHGPQAIARLRGEPTFFMRNRPRLALLLYVANAQGRLVWRSPSSFALLQPPGAARRPVDLRTDAGRLDLLERCWPYARDFGPAILIVLALPLALLTGGYASLTIAVMELAVLSYVLAIFAVIAGRALWWLVRALNGRIPPPRASAGGLLDRNWSVALCHAENASDIDTLLREALGRARSLAAGTDYDGGVLLCVTAGVTTTAARSAAIAATAAVQGIEEAVTVVRLPGERSPDLPVSERVVPVTTLFLGTILLTFAVQADVMADHEREACARAACENGPTGYWSALLWLLDKAVPLGDLGVASPVTVVSRAYGMLAQVVGLVAIGVVVNAGRRHARSLTAARRAGEAALVRSIEDAAKADFGGVFINYRRGPHRGAVNAIRREMAARFGDEKVFIDHRSIPVGGRYPDELRAAVAGCSVMLAIIHRTWLDELKSADGPMLDWVQFEIAAALEAGIRVIPVYLDNAARLVADLLPEKIRDLAHRQDIRVRYECDELDEDLDELVHRVTAAARLR